MISKFPIQCSYSGMYGQIYDTAYNQAFIFYDDEEEILFDEFMYCGERTLTIDLLAASFADRHIS